MIFSAENIMNKSEMIIYADCSAKYLDEMILKTKHILSFSGIVLNSTTVTELTKGLKKYTKDELVSLSDRCAVLIFSDIQRKIKDIAVFLKENDIVFDHIRNYTRSISAKTLLNTGYEVYTDFEKNIISIKNITSKNDLYDVCINKMWDNISNCEIVLGRLWLPENSMSIALHGPNCKVDIGDGCTLGGVAIQVTTNGAVTIGEECMFSINIMLSQADHHLIFDLQTHKRINVNKNIFIGNHVWIGRNVQLLGGCYIPDNCIVGGNSVTSGKFSEPNAIYAGNPAKMIRKNILWTSDGQSRDYMDYSQCSDHRALKYLDDEKMALYNMGFEINNDN